MKQLIDNFWNMPADAFVMNMVIAIGVLLLLWGAIAWVMTRGARRRIREIETRMREQRRRYGM